MPYKVDDFEVLPHIYSVQPNPSQGIADSAFIGHIFRTCHRVDLSSTRYQISHLSDKQLCSIHLFNTKTDLVIV